MLSKIGIAEMRCSLRNLIDNLWGVSTAPSNIPLKVGPENFIRTSKEDFSHIQHLSLPMDLLQTPGIKGHSCHKGMIRICLWAPMSASDVWFRSELLTRWRNAILSSAHDIVLCCNR